MRLWHRIFVCMIGIFLLGFAIFAPSIVKRNFSNDLQREQERCQNEIYFIQKRLQEGEKDRKEAIRRMAEEEPGRKVGYLYYKNEQCVYNSTPLGREEIEELLEKHETAACVRTIGGRHYIVISQAMEEEGALVYTRDIELVYQSRMENIREICMWGGLMLLAFTLAAYWMARWITKPLALLEQNVDKLNRGESGEILKEGEDEIGRLSAAYNSMSLTVLEREEKLRLAASERQRFIEAMSHEMNTPLTSIQDYAQLLQNIKCSEQQQMDALLNIQRETRRMQEMQKKLMAIHSIRPEQIAAEQVDMAKVIAGVEEELKPLIKEKNITVIEQVEQESISGDKTLIHILLSNLLRNSITYSEEGSKVEILVRQEEGGRCRMQIRDYGYGIPKDQIGQVTNAFYRVDKSRSRATGGAGIGLYLCSHIADVLHARMQITSKEGYGTTITVIF